MKQLRSIVAGALIGALLAFQAQAQQSVLQGGTWTSGHVPVYAGSTSSYPVIVDSGSAPAVINSGTAGQIPWYATTGSVLSGNVNTTISGGAVTFGLSGTTLGSLTLAGSTSGGVSIKPQPSAGTYNFNLPITAGSSGQPLLSAGGVGSPMTWGSLSGNTSTFATTTGSLTPGHCAVFDASGNLADNGSGCGGSGTVNSGTAGQFTYYASTGTAVSGTGLLSIVGTTVTANGAVSLSPANANITASPSGTGTVTINPATLGAMDNIAIGATTRSTGAFSTATATTVVSAGVSGSSRGSFTLAGNTSGTVTIQPQASAGTWNFNLPTTAGTSGQPMISGGGGATAMSWGSLSGNTAVFGTVNGALTSGHCLSADVSGNIQDSGAACATGSGTVNSGTAGQLSYYASSTNAVSGNANANISGGRLSLGIVNSTQGALTLFGSSSGTININPQAAAGSYNFNLPTTAGSAGQPLLSAGGGASPMTYGALQGNTTTFVTASGSFVTGNCVSADASGNLVDNGTPCGTGGSGTVTASTAGQMAYYPSSSSVVAGNANVTISGANLTVGVASTSLGTLNLTGSSSGTVSIKPQAAAGTFNFNLPTSAGTAGQVLISGGGGASPMTWGSAGNAAISTQTSNFVAAANSQYCVDTTGGAVTATLPGSPSNSDQIVFVACSSYGANNLTVARNGNNIAGLAEDMTVSSPMLTPLTLIFVTSYGWRLM